MAVCASSDILSKWWTFVETFQLITQSWFCLYMRSTGHHSVRTCVTEVTLQFPCCWRLYNKPFTSWGECLACFKPSKTSTTVCIKVLAEKLSYVVAMLKAASKGTQACTWSLINNQRHCWQSWDNSNICCCGGPQQWGWIPRKLCSKQTRNLKDCQNFCGRQ